MQKGYFRYPAIHQDHLVFVSEGELWSSDLSQDGPANAMRLTDDRGTIKTPVFSPDGTHIAFSSSHEGQSEIFTVAIDGSDMKRLTYLGDDLYVHLWDTEGIYFSTSARQPFARWNHVWRVAAEGGVPERIDIGPANFIHFAPGEARSQTQENKSGLGPCVIQRHGYKEYGYWKRYRGGTAGQVWLNRAGDDNFIKLTPGTLANQARPLWVTPQALVVTSDHEGDGQLYRVDVATDESRWERLTDHQFYVRHQATDGRSIVYCAGGDLYRMSCRDFTSEKLAINYASTRSGRHRKAFSAERYLQDYAIHPRGHHLLINTRGRLAYTGCFNGSVREVGGEPTYRYRCPSFLGAQGKVVIVADDAGCDHIEIHNVTTTPSLVMRLEPAEDLGRIDVLYPAPVTCSEPQLEDQEDDEAHQEGPEEALSPIMVYNHRHEVICIDPMTHAAKIIDRSTHGFLSGGNWSSDGRWFAYGAYVERRKRVIKIYDHQTGDVHQITPSFLEDSDPVFDPQGKFLYFIGERHMDPVHDHFQFEHGFPFGSKIFAISLTEKTPSPFLKLPVDLARLDDAEDAPQEDARGQADKESDKAKTPEPVSIDFEGISGRVAEFPIPPGIYTHLVAAKNNKIYYISHPVEGALEHQDRSSAQETVLEQFDLESLKTETLLANVDDLDVAEDRETLLVSTRKGLRVLKAGEKNDDDDSANRKTGAIDLSRIKLFVTPPNEWQQMFKEAWRLQQDHYWVEDMAKIDWDGIYDKYAPLLERVATREEVSDLLWEMQGELGTSHAYVMGGDLKRPPAWRLGGLAADFAWDSACEGYRIVHMDCGDPYQKHSVSPLLAMGVELRTGDVIKAVDGVILTKTQPPESQLISKAGKEVTVTVLRSGAEKCEEVVIKPLANSQIAAYKAWVERNRDFVHRASDGQIGYVHIPDMGPEGFAEFHRSFLQEMDRRGLIVDVRFNGGGSVSQLLIEKLARKRLGYDVSRYMGTVPYPEESPCGPMVCLTNEYAGSDGDMFSHVFKMMKLGPLIGARTWGGVIGIWPRYGLIDGGMTTQPEFSFWFKDVGWSIENYGVEPDREVDIRPQDYLNHHDPQVEAGLSELLKRIEHHVEKEPDMENRPILRHC